jgi:hypothetical protein
MHCGIWDNTAIDWGRAKKKNQESKSPSLSNGLVKRLCLGRMGQNETNKNIVKEGQKHKK